MENDSSDMYETKQDYGFMYFIIYHMAPMDSESPKFLA